MTIKPVQLNIEPQNQQVSRQKKPAKNSYLNANYVVETNDLVKPLPPEGHLIHDNLANSVKYYFKDIEYNLKSVKNGFNGTANDHQLGRLNDVGLTVGGLGIATYLATKTTNPKVRLMEYIGLGSFLTAMSVYPKLAINTPGKLIHGYDFDKEFIDDQGRKKSVQQDSNYVPYDMYLGEIPEEDISIIGDKMGIPRDIKNRNDVIKEQMRKVATQNNTLWMLTAGVTPLIAGLLCCGLERYVVAPALEKSQNATANKNIAKALESTKNMNLEIASIEANKLSNKIETILKNYSGQELPKEEFENIFRTITEGLDENASEGIKKDLTKILGTSATGNCESVVITNETIEELIQKSKNVISKNNKDKLEKLLVPTKEEVENIIKRFSPEADFEKGITTSTENLPKIKEAINQLIENRIQNLEGIPKEFLNSQKNKILENISFTVSAQKSSFVSEESLKKVVDFAKTIGEFKENKQILEKCKSIKFEFAPETIIANSYSKFENTLLNELGIKYKDLKKIRESETYAKEILDKKMIELCKDETKYQKTLEKLGKIISQMEVKLNGASETESHIKDLITAIENNYNNTAKRLASIGSFEETIDRLVKENVETLSNSIQSRQELFEFLDGTATNKAKDLIMDKGWYDLSEAEKLEYLKHNAFGQGSSKNQEISRILERYQGAKNSFYRVLHTFDFYNRSLKPNEIAKFVNGNEELAEEIIKFGKDKLLNATASDHTMKLGTDSNPIFYKNYMNTVYATEGSANEVTKGKGYISELTKTSLSKENSLANGNVLERFQLYINRFKNIVANSTVEFKKPHHIIDPSARKNYTQAEKTRMALFNLVGQSPVDMVKGASNRRYNTQKWVRIVSGITAGVFGVAILSQFGFGKLRNPQNLQKKQVNNDNNQ